MRMKNRSFPSLLILAALCFCIPANVFAEISPSSLPPFYSALQKHIPAGKLGEIIKKESIATSIPNAEAWRIAYVSSDLLDRLTVSTAIVVAPRGKPPKNGRPIVAWAHGTTGTAQNCGPSQVANPAQPLNQYFLASGDSWTDYGLPALARLIERGYVVVGTDYQGLGGGGRHQYVVAQTQGRDIINSIRAAGRMNLAGDGKKALVYGWSQGGGAVLAAAGMPEYISRSGTAYDGVRIVGFISMAPPDIATIAPKTVGDEDAAHKALEAFIGSFTNNIFDFTHLGMTLWANANTFANLKLTDLYTDEGAKLISEVMANKCMHVAADTLNYTVGDNYKTLLKAKPENTIAWVKALIDGSVPAAKPVAPVIIYWGTKDMVVPPMMGKLYQEQMCALGANVTRVRLPGEQTHFSTPHAAEPLYLEWMQARLEGHDAENGCSEPSK